MATEPNDLVIHILERIQSDISGLQQDVGGLREDVSSLREDVSSLREDVSSLKEDVVDIRQDIGSLRAHVAAHGERLLAVEVGLDGLRATTAARFDELHGEIVLTNTTLGLMNERMGFFERATTAAVEGRARLDLRVDHLESRVDRLERAAQAP